MQDLRFELLKLDQDEYQISENFNKKVMSKVKSQNKKIKVQKAFSILSIACSYIVCIIIANNKGIIDLNKIVDAKKINNAVQEMSENIDNLKNNTNLKNASANEKEETAKDTGASKTNISKDNIIDENIDININETIDMETYRKDDINSLDYDSLPEETNVDNSEELSKIKAEGTELTENTSIVTASAISDTEKLYIKKMHKEDYIKSIEDVLKENDYKYQIKDNIISLDGDINKIYELMQDFLDVIIEEKDGKIFISLDE